MSKAKIIRTLGPACDSDEVLEERVRTGMEVARVNFAHGTHEEHRRRIERVRWGWTPLPSPPTPTR
jgi:pyruvate kinase